MNVRLLWIQLVCPLTSTKGIVQSLERHPAWPELDLECGLPGLGPWPELDLEQGLGPIFAHMCRTGARAVIVANILPLRFSTGSFLISSYFLKCWKHWKKHGPHQGHFPMLKLKHDQECGKTIFVLIWCRIGSIWAKRTISLDLKSCELQTLCIIYGKVPSTIFNRTMKGHSSYGTSGHKQFDHTWSYLEWPNLAKLDSSRDGSKPKNVCKLGLGLNFFLCSTVPF